MKEQSIRKLGIALRHGKKIESSKAFLSLHDAVPCILHLENRVGLKFFTMLLRAGLSNATSGATFAVQTAQGQRFDSFFQTVNDIMNTVVIGSVFYPGQWDCPKDKSKNEVGIICLDNNRTRKVINSFDLFIDLCIVEDDKKQQWKTCIDHYRKAMKLLRQKTNLSSGEIERFQSHIDAFFVIWVNLTGHEGVTNYIHMLASGHISEYLVYWGNLYDHSQQGWEAFNSLIKTFFFRRTGRGGAGNQGRGPKSRLRPIARWLSRRVIWMCGYDYHFKTLFQFYVLSLVPRATPQHLRPTPHHFCNSVTCRTSKGRLYATSYNDDVTSGFPNDDVTRPPKAGNLTRFRVTSDVIFPGSFMLATSDLTTCSFRIVNQ